MKIFNSSAGVKNGLHRLDVIDHLDAIINDCETMEQLLKEHQRAVSVIEFTRDFHIDREREIDLNKVPAEKLVAAYYDKDRLQYTVAVLQEIFKKITGRSTEK